MKWDIGGGRLLPFSPQFGEALLHFSDGILNAFIGDSYNLDALRA
jgi:hypothetical protein